MISPTAKLLYTAEEAGSVLAIGRTRVFALMASGELPSVLIGRSRRITAAALADYVDRLDQHADQRSA